VSATSIEQRSPARDTSLDDRVRTASRLPARPRLLIVGLLLVAAGLGVLELRWLALGTGLWFAGLVMVTAGCWGPASRTATNTSAEPATTRLARWELAVVGAMLGVGLLLRVWAPEQYPGGIHVDEAAMGLVAVDVLEGHGPYPFGFAFIGDPAPFMYAEALMMSVFGVSVGSARLLAGLAGTAGLFALWLLARPLFGATVALLATALLTVTAAHLHFSRMALNIIEIPLFGVLAAALAWRGFQRRRPAWHLLAGMALGFSQYANFGARAFVLSTGALYGVMLIRQPRAWRTTIASGLLALFGMVLVLGPQLAYVRDDPQSLVDRLKYRSVFRRWDQAVEIHGTDDTTGVLAGQVALNLSAFVANADRGPFYAFAQQPLLAPPLAVLFLAGLLIALLRCRDPRYVSLLLICAGVLTAGVLSAGAPQFHRLLPMVPIACLLAAIAGIELFRALSGPFVKRAPSAVACAAVALPSVLVLWVAADGLLTVFAQPPSAVPWQPQTAWAHWTGEQAQRHTVLLAGNPDVFSWDERIRLQAGGGKVLDVANPSVDLPAALAEGEPFVVALNPKLDDWLPLLHYHLPGVTFEPVPGPQGRPLLLAAMVPASIHPSAEPHGLRGLLSIDDGPANLPRDDAALAFRESSRLSDRRPFHASWSGLLVIERNGAHRLEVYTDGGCELILDGRTVLEAKAAPNPRSVRADQPLTPGPHTLEVHYSYLRGPGTFELRWQPPGGERTIIPPAALRPS
jgi:4-amino-4-deoxy-L-arabinose transferase-like glycosyltransferase